MTDSLHSLIVLLSGTRLPEYEEEIFADDTKARLYLIGLADANGFSCRMTGTLSRIDLSIYALWYSRAILQERWLPAEKYICKEPWVARLYEQTQPMKTK